MSNHDGDVGRHARLEPQLLVIHLYYDVIGDHILNRLWSVPNLEDPSLKRPLRVGIHHPAECLDLLFNTPRIQFTVGNHDLYFIHGLPTPQPTNMSNGEVEHQHWTHAQLLPQLRSTLAQWPYVIEREFEGVRVTFAHYGIAESGNDFLLGVYHPTAVDLDKIFSFSNSSLIFYGHDH